MNRQDDPQRDERTARQDEERLISANSLLQGHQQVLIEHDGEIYRLVLTRNNKLLLQK